MEDIDQEIRDLLSVGQGFQALCRCEEYLTADHGSAAESEFLEARAA